MKTMQLDLFRLFLGIFNSFVFEKMDGLRLITHLVKFLPKLSKIEGDKNFLKLGEVDVLYFRPLVVILLIFKDFSKLYYATLKDSKGRFLLLGLVISTLTNFSFKNFPKSCRIDIDWNFLFSLRYKNWIIKVVYIVYYFSLLEIIFRDTHEVPLTRS